MTENPETPSSASAESSQSQTLFRFSRAMLTERVDRLRRRLRSREELTNTAVHEIRVVVRRTEAVLALFSPLLRKRTAKRLRKQLRRLRNKLGLVRNLDVFLERCLTWTDVVPREDLSRLILAVADKRRRAARRAGRVLGMLRWKKTMRSLDKCQRESSASPQETISTWPDLLSASLDKPMALLEKTSSMDLTDFAALHTVRLACKRLRYLCELVAEHVPNETTTELTQRLRATQQRLGNVNDSVTAVRLLEEMQEFEVDSEIGATLGHIVQLERTKLADALVELQAWWHADNLAVAVMNWKQAICSATSPSGFAS